jgi:hypothetical protein
MPKQTIKEVAMTMVWTYVIYLAVSVGLTLWVARTLYKNGRVFLIDSFLGNEKLADSVNHLLVVGFYLINIGFVSLALKFGGKAGNVQQAIEYLSMKLGVVLVILGVMHLGNVFLFSGMRKRALRQQFPVDVEPAGPLENREGRYYPRQQTTRSV